VVRKENVAHSVVCEEVNNFLSQVRMLYVVEH
jgi:hypothetical protein